MVGEMRLERRHRVFETQPHTRESLIDSAKKDYSKLISKISCGEKDRIVIDDSLNKIVNSIIEACLITADICLCFRAISDPFNEREDCVLNRQKSILVWILYEYLTAPSSREELRQADSFVFVLWLYLENFCSNSDLTPKYENIKLNVYKALSIPIKNRKPP